MKKLLLSAVLVSSGLMASYMPVTKEEAMQRETLFCACKGQQKADKAQECRAACTGKGNWSGKAVLTQDKITCVCNSASGEAPFYKVTKKIDSCSRCGLTSSWDGDFLLRDKAPLRVRKNEKVLFDQGQVSDYRN